LGADVSSALVLEITGVGDGMFEGGAGALSAANGAGSRMVERRRGGSCAPITGADVSASGGAGRSSGGGV
jgi:hypothetical protein